MRRHAYDKDPGTYTAAGIALLALGALGVIGALVEAIA